MIHASNATTFAYATGEEVVVRLGEVDVFDLDHLALLPQQFRPSWTIGRITARIAGPWPRYVVRANVCEFACIAIVDERHVDGLA